MKIALIGYGRMGSTVESVAAEEGHEVVARIDEEGNRGGRGITPESLNGAEVAVEFSTPEATVPNVAACARAGIDLAVGTTGWLERLDEARDAVDAAGTGMIWAPNFSLGVNLFFRLVREAGRLVDRLEAYDVHVSEVHHRHKVDHPSGTARKLAEILLDEVQRKGRWAETPGDGPIDPSTLQVAAVRAGENPGTHLVALEGPDDRIELRHEARGREGFGRGALVAAEWIRGKRGVFTIDDLFEEMLE